MYPFRGRVLYPRHVIVKVVESPTTFDSGVKMYLFMVPGVACKMMSLASVSPTEEMIVNESVGWVDSGLSIAPIKLNWNYSPAKSSSEEVTVREFRRETTEQTASLMTCKRYIKGIKK